MQKEPFIITLGNEDLPNLSESGGENFGFEYRQTNIWKDESSDILKLLSSVNEKMDVIIRLIKKSGKA